MNSTLTLIPHAGFDALGQSILSELPFFRLPEIAVLLKSDQPVFCQADTHLVEGGGAKRTKSFASKSEKFHVWKVD